jgi:hypothetical protein
MLLELYKKLKLRLNEVRAIEEFEAPPFFQGPNHYFNHHGKILFQQRGRPKLKLISPASRLGGSIIDPNAKIMFFQSPKNGSTLVKNFVYRELGLGTLPDPDNIHSLKFKRLVFSANNALDRFGVLNWPKHSGGYKIYMALRDPYQRLVSFYINKVLSDFFRKKNPNENRAKANIENFLYFLKQADPTIEHGSLSFEMLVSILHQSLWDTRLERRLPDRHLGLQVTPDFAAAVSSDCQFFKLNQLPEFLKYWYWQHHRQTFQGALPALNKSPYHKKVPHAYRLSIEELLNLGFIPSSNSFYQDALALKVKEIYALDYQFWDQIKDKNLDFSQSFHQSLSLWPLPQISIL